VVALWALLVLWAFLARPSVAADSGWLDGKVTAVLIGGQEIRGHVLKRLREAQAFIGVEVYTFGDRELADVLADRRKAGVDVQVVTDRGSEVNRAMKRYLSGQGVPVWFSPTQRDAINHVKILVVDGRLAMAGGANWGEHSPQNFDAMVEVEGPPAKWLAVLFRQDVDKARGRFTRDPGPGIPEGGPRTVRLLTDADIRRAVMDVIWAAKRSLDVGMFVMTDREIVSSLIEAHQRGVRVRVVLDPGEEGEMPLSGGAFNRLQKKGVPVRWFVGDAKRRERLHLKAMVADGKLAVVGSANWTARGLKANHECVMVLSDLTAVHHIQRAIAHVWDRGRP